MTSTPSSSASTSPGFPPTENLAAIGYNIFIVSVLLRAPILSVFFLRKGWKT